MSKPKHPSPMTLRQGQTVYMVWSHCDWNLKTITNVVRHYQIGSPKTRIPEFGEMIINPVNINYFRKMMTGNPRRIADMFYSRKMAIRRAHSS